MEVGLSNINFDQLAKKPSLKTVVLCVNNRYARRVLEQFNQLLGNDNKTVAIPSIVPQHAWVQNLANDLCFHTGNKFAQHVFSNFAAQQLWELSIKEAETDNYFLSVKQMASLAFDANNLINEWHINADESEHSVDYQRFLVWQAKYQEKLLAADAEDINLTYENICDCLDNGAVLKNLENLVLVGFNQLSPRMKMVLSKLENLGVNLYQYTSEYPIADHIEYYQFNQEHDEWHYAISWAKENLLNNPKGRFAIIVPNPSENIHYIHRLMRQHLSPLGLSYNIAAAPKLSEWKLVDAINLWLGLLYDFSKGKDCDAASIGKALLSLSVLNNKSLNHWAANLDSKLRKHEIQKLNFKQFITHGSDKVVDFINALEQCVQLIKDSTNTSIDKHTYTIRKVLDVFGFVDNIELNSTNWQCLQAFDQGLNSLLSLSPIYGNIGFYQAINVLNQLSQSISFQPQRDPNSRLDVLGFLEAEGGYWDGVWVLGLTDRVFPAQAQPNALIPWPAMQRSNAPRSTPERELQWAESTLGHVLHSAKHVCFSYAQLSGDEILKPSALLNVDIQDYIKPDNYQANITPLALDSISDDYGPSLNRLEDDITQLKGGVSVLDKQSKNPLWAFVEYRLKAVQLPHYAKGFNSNIRGMIIHECMQIIWLQLKDKNGLEHAINNDNLDEIIFDSFEKAVKILKNESDVSFNSKALHELERNRSIKIIKAWLEQENQRIGYFKAQYLEQKYDLVHNGLKLSYRVDRIDELEDGRKLIFDYKSGLNKVGIANSWTRKRLIDLQLPLYATGFDAQEVAGLAFIRINSRATDSYGLSDGDCGLNGIQHFTDIPSLENLTWQNLIQNWHKSTRSLMDEYASGYAANQFLDNTDMQYCEVLPFLRLQQNQND